MRICMILMFVTALETTSVDASDQTAHRIAAARFSPGLAAPSLLPGIARPRQSTELRFLVSGMVGKVLIREGQHVRKGQALVMLDDRLAQAQLQLAAIEAKRAGALRQAKRKWEFEQTRLERVEEAFARDGVSEFELTEQRAMVGQAEAVYQTQLEAVEVAEGNYRLAKERVRQHTLFAPFDGVVTQLEVKNGTSIDPSMPILRVDNLKALEVEVHVPTDAFGKLQVGQEISVAADSPVNANLPARVVFTSPIMNAASNTFRCLLIIDNEVESLPAGFSVTFQP